MRLRSSTGRPSAASPTTASTSSSSSTSSSTSKKESPHVHVKRRLVLRALGIRAIMLLYAVVMDVLLPDHNATGVFTFHPPPSHPLPFFLRSFTKWDSAYFLSLAQDKYQSLPSHAFFPLYPSLLRILALPPSLPPVLVALLLNIVCSIVAALALFELTLLVDKRGGNERGREGGRAWWAATLFLVNPASIFFVTAYSEALYAALSFSGLYLITLASFSPYKHTRLLPFLLGTVFLSLAGATRSNGLLLILPLLFLSPALPPFLLHLLHLLPPKPSKSSRPVLPPFLVFLLDLALRGVGCVCVLFPYLAWQYKGYRTFCPSKEGGREGGREAWCEARVPNMYNHVQATYWNVGFLNHWQWRQVPNFLLAAPVFFLTFQGLYFYARCVWEKRRERDLRLLGFYLHWAVLALFILFVAHVQISTRLLFSACPPLYWHLTTYFLPKEEDEEEGGRGGEKKRAASGTKREGGRKGGRKGWWYVGLYMVVFNLVGPAMHVNFLPWT